MWYNSSSKTQEGDPTTHATFAPPSQADVKEMATRTSSSASRASYESRGEDSRDAALSENNTGREGPPSEAFDRQPAPRSGPSERRDSGLRMSFPLTGQKGMMNRHTSVSNSFTPSPPQVPGGFAPANQHPSHHHPYPPSAMRGGGDRRSSYGNAPMRGHPSQHFGMPHHSNTPMMREGPSNGQPYPPSSSGGYRGGPPMGRHSFYGPPPNAHYYGGGHPSNPPQQGGPLGYPRQFGLSSDSRRASFPLKRGGAFHPPSKSFVDQQYPYGSNTMPSSQRSSTITPSTQMAGMNLGSNSREASSRSPSPPVIPPPPLKAPFSAPAKLRAPIATRALPLSTQEEFLGPLRDSRRLNLLRGGPPSERRDATPGQHPKRSAINDERDCQGTGRDTQPDKKKTKPNVPSSNEMEASLLLGLRSSGSSSPTISVNTEPSLTTENAPAAQPKAAPDIIHGVPMNYPKSLEMPHDSTSLNSLHCFIRSNLLEVFVIEKSNNKSPTNSSGAAVGRVGLRCVHCARARKAGTWEDREEAPMAMFYPKSIAEIYRLVTSWQRCHLRRCRHLPPKERSEWEYIRQLDKSRGKTSYWADSAKELGLVDCLSRSGGVRFDPARFPSKPDTEDVSNTTEPVSQQGGLAAPPVATAI